MSQKTVPTHKVVRMRTIPKKTVTKILRLLELNAFSHRTIARRMHVSRNSVNAIASRKPCNPEVTRKPPDDDPEEPSGPPARCPGCGALVYMPCLLCKLRKDHPRTIARPRPEVFVSAALNLRPEHRDRYEQIRKSYPSRSA